MKQYNTTNKGFVVIIRDAEVLNIGHFKSNAGHVSITRNGKTVFKRGGTSCLGKDWYDRKHWAIVQALNALEQAIQAAVS